MKRFSNIILFFEGGRVKKRTSSVSIPVFCFYLLLSRYLLLLTLKGFHHHLVSSYYTYSFYYKLFVYVSHFPSVSVLVQLPKGIILLVLFFELFISVINSLLLKSMNWIRNEMKWKFEVILHKVKMPAQLIFKVRLNWKKGEYQCEDLFFYSLHPRLIIIMT